MPHKTVEEINPHQFYGFDSADKVLLGKPQKNSDIAGNVRTHT